MGRFAVFLCAAMLPLAGAGCVSGPMLDNPLLLQPVKPQDNPLYVAGNPAPQTYGLLFEKVLDVLDDYFEVAYSNRYEGRIETFPRVSPGIGQPWKGGSPDPYQRFLATLQSMRNCAIVLIKPANGGGYFVDVQVYRELEDLAQPLKASTSSAVFRYDLGVERQFEVIDQVTFDAIWIPKGRDVAFEQEILCRLAHAKLPCPPQPVAPQPVVVP